MTLVKSERDELREIYEEFEHGLEGIPPKQELKLLDAIPKLLDALDEAEKQIQNLRKNQPQMDRFEEFTGMR